MFRSKENTLQSSVSVMVYSLAGLDHLTEENVAEAMAVVEETGLSRILVTDSAGQALYDTRETGNAVGDYVFYSEVVQALMGNDAFTCSYQGGAFRSRASSPVMYRSSIIGAVYAYDYDTEQGALLKGLQENLLRLSTGIGLVVLLLSGVLSAALTKKLGQLLTAIRQVRQGAYSHRADIRGRDEIAQLGQEFNSLVDRLQTTEDARRRFVSDASHELKTPLAAIRLLTDSILQTDNIDPDTTREFVSDIGWEAERLSRITEDLLRLTRLDSGVLDPAVVVDALPVLEQAMRMLSLLAHEKQADLTYDAGEGCWVRSTRDEVHQVIYNLTENALKYSGAGGTVQVSLRQEEGQVVLRVEDDGPGIPEEDLPGSSSGSTEWIRLGPGRQAGQAWAYPSCGTLWKNEAARWRLPTGPEGARRSRCAGPWRKEAQDETANGAGAEYGAAAFGLRGGCGDRRRGRPRVWRIFFRGGSQSGGGERCAAGGTCGAGGCLRHPGRGRDAAAGAAAGTF